MNKFCTTVENNKVKDGSKEIIIKTKVVKKELKEALQKINNPGNVPEKNKILNAFAHCEPSDIKVVIIGTSPAATPGIATGLSFSTDKYDNEVGGAIKKVHKALKIAEILDGDVHSGIPLWT